MSVYARTPLAQADIFDIWWYIADDSEDAADLVEQAIYDACALVAQAPRRGHSRPDLTSRSLRFWTLTRYPNYTVVYRPEPAPPSGCRRSPREKKYTTHPETAPVTARPQVTVGMTTTVTIPLKPGKRWGMADTLSAGVQAGISAS